jgi:1-acyl-sn-glycerol-3-phosphate acyltransferase
MPAADASPVALRSEKAMAFFNVAFGRTFAGSMRALRIPHWGLPDYAPGRPLVIFAPHPSWWDAILFMLLLRRYFISRPAFLPMDAEAIRKYPFMTKLGVFGVEQGSPRGAVHFLNTAKQVLAAPQHMLWMNAPGRFVDVRERPVPITPGLVRLAEIAPDALIAPLAFEYAFWTEKQAEAFAAFGPAMAASTPSQLRSPSSCRASCSGLRCRIRPSAPMSFTARKACSMPMPWTSCTAPRLE